MERCYCRFERFQVVRSLDLLDFGYVKQLPSEESYRVITIPLPRGPVISLCARSFVILNTYIYFGGSGVCTLHPAAHTRMTEVEAFSIWPTVSSITGAITRKFFHSRGIVPTPREGQSPGMKKRPCDGSGYTTHIVL